MFGGLERAPRDTLEAAAWLTYDSYLFPAIVAGVLLPIALAMFALGHVELGVLVVAVELLFVGAMGFALRRR